MGMPSDIISISTMTVTVSRKPINKQKNSLFVLLVITTVGNQTEGGKSLDEEVVLPVVGSVPFFPLSKHNKLQNTLK